MQGRKTLRHLVTIRLLELWVRKRSSKKIRLILSLIAAIGYLTSSCQCKPLVRIAGDVSRINGCQEGVKKDEAFMNCLTFRRLTSTIVDVPHR